MKFRTVFFTMVLIALIFLNCKRATSPENPNMPPTTTITNVPVEGDTIFPLVQITWDGGDQDGYIVGCEYRFTTYHLFKGDSFSTDWQFTSDEVLEIIFESSDSLNKQVLQVRAVDNDGGVDPTPARRTFYTRRTIVPQTTILAPQNAQTYFFLDQTTDWWPGIHLVFTAYDQDGEVEAYAYSVDGNDWIWTSDTSIFLVKQDFDPPYEGTHEIRVTARDNTNLMDPQGAVVQIDLVKPTFEKDILIIDQTDENQFPSSARTTDAVVDSFYSEIFGLHESWDFLQKGMPPKTTLGQYKMIIWHADNKPTTRPHEFVQHTEELADYLNVGGDLIVSGWRILKSFAWEENFPKTFEEGTFVHDYLHINKVDETPAIPSDMFAVNGINGMDDMYVDSLKLKSFPYLYKLNQINVISELGGFTKTIFLYGGANMDFVGRPCGLHYYGTSFDVIVLGFPLYFMKKEQARIVGAQILERMGY
ncbi:hypothetical protein [Caldithrix abyssi]